MNYNKKFGKYILLLCLLTGCASGPSFDVTLQSLIEEITVRERSVRYPNPVYIRKRRTHADIPEDSIRYVDLHTMTSVASAAASSQRREVVIFEETAPGAITRLCVEAPDKEAVLRIYLDEHTQPELQFALGDAIPDAMLPSPFLFLCTDKHQEGRYGKELLLPVPYAGQCRITLETGLTEVAACAFQIDYRCYPEEIRIETFSAKALWSVAEEWVSTNSVGLQSAIPDKASSYQRAKNLAVGDSLTLCLPKGEKAVYALVVNVQSQEGETTAPLLRQLWLTGMFDGGKCVQAPLYDFGVGNDNRDAAVEVAVSAQEGMQIQSHWLMPYRKEGEIALTNFSDCPVEVSLTAYVHPFPWIEGVLYFHADWQRVQPSAGSGADVFTPSSTGMQLRGKGVYKGQVFVNDLQPWSYLSGFTTIPFHKELAVEPLLPVAPAIQPGGTTVFWYGDGYSEASVPALTTADLRSLLPAQRQ